MEREEEAAPPLSPDKYGGESPATMANEEEEDDWRQSVAGAAEEDVATNAPLSEKKTWKLKKNVSCKIYTWRI